MALFNELIEQNIKSFASSLASQHFIHQTSLVACGPLHPTYLDMIESCTDNSQLRFRARNPGQIVVQNETMNGLLWWPDGLTV
ncbi:unnamed protein product [Dovyalis caffra]|uniref:Mitochondrial pyruvate carrier n=1 Tax=Dovyalis caffra TaxID=77055 RepID=A0AAV1SLA4_9ROSI|nr:unnamed protein product [Dovyalis caffra]